MPTPRKYRTKPYIDAPAEVEAVRLTPDNQGEVMAWCGGRPWSRPPMRAITGILVPAPDGDKPAPYGTWITKRSDGTHDALTQEEMEAFEALDDIPQNEEAAMYRAWWQQADREMRDWKFRCAERAATEIQLRQRITELEQELEAIKQTT